MKKINQTIYITLLILILITFIVVGLVGATKDKLENKKSNALDHIFYDENFQIIASQENEELIESTIKPYANSKGYNIYVEYAGTLDIIEKINQGEEYDAVWLSNSIWGYMLNDSSKLKNSKFTNISPIIFGIKKSKAEELGFIGKEIYTKDIVQAISEGKLKFSMSNPTSTNSGASAYLGVLSTLAGNPEVLTKENLNDENLKQNLKTFFTGLERSSGSEDFLEELFLKGDYEAVFTYESSIININKKLESEGKETLYAIYPIDGVSITDSPLAYIDNKNEVKKEIFEDIQSYILSEKGQNSLQENGKRTWYGGINENVDKATFNPDWGIDTTKYITPIKYPNTEVIKLVLNLYQSELRKPVHVAFCLDYSGSMLGEGIEQLKNAMKYILTDESAKDFIQFSEKGKIDIIPFNGEVRKPWSTTNGIQTTELLDNINKFQPSGLTAIYPASIKALDLLKDENKDEYNLSVVLMTDGIGNVGEYKELSSKYASLTNKIPIYSIMFGDADEYQLEEIASLTNGKIFDGKKDLVKAFKEVRGYN